MAHTSINLRTFDDLLNDFLVDLRVLDEEGLISPEQLIKVAQRVNYDLGLRIHQTKEIILEVDHHIAKLPEDFYVLNFAMLTGHHRCITPITWAGRTTENIFVSGDTCCLTPLTYDTNRLNPNKTYPCDNQCGVQDGDPWFQRSCYSVCGGDSQVRVIEHRGHEVREYSWFEKLYIKPATYLDPLSINSRMTQCGTAEIKNGHLYVNNRDSCQVYISYQGNLEDEHGNLLVLSHPEIDFYYLAALTEYVFKILWYSAGEEVAGKYKEAKEETRIARVRALSIVNCPDFSDLQETFRSNRDAQYAKYYNYFATNVFRQFYHSLPF